MKQFKSKSEMAAACQKLDFDFLEITDAHDIRQLINRADTIEEIATKRGWKPRYKCRNQLNELRREIELPSSSIEGQLGKGTDACSLRVIQAGTPSLGKRR